MSDELKPCPFCKGNAEWSVKAGSWGYYPARHSVYCPCCDIKFFEGDEFEEGLNKRERLACRAESLKLWNSRPIEDALRAKLAIAVEALEFQRDNNDSGQNIDAAIEALAKIKNFADEQTKAALLLRATV